MMKKEKKEKEKSFLTLLEQNGFVNSQSSSKLNLWILNQAEKNGKAFCIFYQLSL